MPRGDKVGGLPVVISIRGFVRETEKSGGRRLECLRSSPEVQAVRSSSDPAGGLERNQHCGPVLPATSPGCLESRGIS
jgi:hypothetical protein